MLGAVHEYPLLIQERHLDTFGHVNNARYLEILEEARWDLITRNGFGLDEIARRRLGPTIVEISLRFQRELRNRQEVVVKSWCESYVGKILRFQQEIRDAEDKLYCAATFVVGLFDVTARKLIPPTPEWLRAVGLRPEDVEAKV